MKNISTNETNQAELAKLGAVDALSLWISKPKILELEGLLSKKEPTSSTPRKKGSDRVAQFLIQITGALRNLALPNSHKIYFIESDCVTNLCNLIDTDEANVYSKRQELMMNVSRIFRFS